MAKRIIFATGNKDKLKEIKEIIGEISPELLTMRDADIHVDIKENGSTYEENALIKVRAIAPFLKPGDIAMADDSGLEIDYLNKEPGIYSARYMGEDTSYKIKNAALMERLKGVAEEKRTARFVCAIAAILPDGTEITTRGVIEGIIAHEECGKGGFGYDPIFYVPNLRKTTAELTDGEKNQVSHRGRALRAMKEKLKEIL